MAGSLRRGVAGQVIDAELVSASTGAAFTGAVTCYVTGDNNPQAIGTVASGLCTHKGHGCHQYTPTAIETDYACVAFTFTGSGAIPATQTVYPTP